MEYSFSYVTLAGINNGERAGFAYNDETGFL